MASALAGPTKAGKNDFTGPNNTDNSADNEDYSKTPKKNWLNILATKKLLKQDLDDDERKPFDKMTCCQKSVGDPLVIFNSGNDTPVLKLYADGRVGMLMSADGKMEGKDHIDNLLKGAVLAKAGHRADGVYAYAQSKTEELMLVKAAELAGLKIKNPPDPKDALDKVNPELAKKMEQEWALLHPKSDISAGYSAKEADVSGLVKTPSPLDDDTLSAKSPFARAAQLPSASQNPPPVNGDTAPIMAQRRILATGPQLT